MVAALLAAAALAVAHPLHTTLTEMSVDATNHTVRAVIRVFSDDIGIALARRGGAKAPVSDAQASAYVVSQFAVIDRATKPIALRSCGVKRSGDLLWVCVEGDVGTDARGLSLRNTILCDLFSDQVNIVQVAAAVGTNAKSVLFTRGDGAKNVL